MKAKREAGDAVWGVVGALRSLVGVFDAPAGVDVALHDGEAPLPGSQLLRIPARGVSGVRPGRLSPVRGMSIDFGRCFSLSGAVGIAMDDAAGC